MADANVFRPRQDISVLLHQFHSHVVRVQVLRRVPSEIQLHLFSHESVELRVPDSIPSIPINMIGKSIALKPRGFEYSVRYLSDQHTYALSERESRRIDPLIQYSESSTASS